MIPVKAILSSLALLSGLALNGCGKELGRLPFSHEGTQVATVPLAAGDVAFWTDLSVKYEGHGELAYEIELEQGGHKVASVVCDALTRHNLKIGWVETAFGDSRSLRGNGKMACAGHVPKAGLTNVRATLAFTTRPRLVSLAKADLVVKQ